MQGNQNRLCGLIMRSNCCCDSHSTTRRVSCKKGSISSAARTQACSPHCCCCRVQNSEARGRGVGWWRHHFGKYVDLLSTRKRTPRFRILPDLVSKKCVFRHCVYRIRVDGRPKWCKTCVYTKERFRVDGPLIFGPKVTFSHMLLKVRRSVSNVTHLSPAASVVQENAAKLLLWNFKNIVWMMLPSPNSH